MKSLILATAFAASMAFALPTEANAKIVVYLGCPTTAIRWDQAIASARAMAGIGRIASIFADACHAAKPSGGFAVMVSAMSPRLNAKAAPILSGPGVAITASSSM